jgi:hypothetical protein
LRWKSAPIGAISTGVAGIPKKVGPGIGNRFVGAVDSIAVETKSGVVRCRSWTNRIGGKLMNLRRMAMFAVPAFVALAAMITPAEAG